jgi:hypothetical protein
MIAIYLTYNNSVIYKDLKIYRKKCTIGKLAKDVNRQVIVKRKSCPICT